MNIALSPRQRRAAGGGGCAHGRPSEGYSRPRLPGPRPAPYIDELLISGRKVGVHHIWGCDHYKTTLNAFKFKQAYKKRTDLVKDAMLTVLWRSRCDGEGHRRGDQQGRSVCRRR